MTHAAHTSTALAVKEGREEDAGALVPLAENEMEGHAVKNFVGINLGGDVVTKSTEHLAEEEKVLVRWLYNFCRENKWTRTELFTFCKIDYSTLYRIWTDKYKRPDGTRYALTSFIEKIKRAKDLLERRKDIVSSGFLHTRIFEEIEVVCRNALVRNKISFIYSDSHIGKTTALKEFQRRNNGGQTTFVTLPPAAGVQLMTRTIAKSLHVNTSKSYERLIEDVMDSLDKSRLLIIDEVQRAFTTYQKTSVMRCLDVLRDIHDQTGCGMVLCGTNVFRDAFNEGEFFKYLQQLKRRGLYPLQLPKAPYESDLRMAVKSFKLEWPTGEVLTTFKHLAHDGFGLIMTRLEDGAEWAKNQGHRYTWSDFMAAHNTIRKMSLEDRE